MADFNGVDFTLPLPLLEPSGPLEGNNFFLLAAALEGGLGPPPVITWLSPTPGTLIQRTREIRFKLTDLDTVLVVVSVKFPSLGLEEVAFRPLYFATLYNTSSLEDVEDGLIFTLRRTGGWPASPTIQVDVVDAEGQSDG